MTEMGIYLLYNEHCIEFECLYMPCKVQGELSGRRYCEQVYYIHSDLPILRQMEKRRGRILDANLDDVVDDIKIKGQVKGHCRTR